MKNNVLIVTFVALFLLMIFLVVMVVMQNIKIDKLMETNTVDSVENSKSDIISDEKQEIINSQKEENITIKEDTAKVLNDNEVKEIENILNGSNETKNFLTLLCMGTNKSGISEDAKIDAAYFYYAHTNSDELKKNELPYSPSTEEMMVVPSLYKISYIEGLVNTIFEEKLNLEEIEYHNMTEGNIFISLVGFGASEYNITEAKKESESKYTLTFTRSEYGEIKGNYTMIISGTKNNFIIHEIKEI